MSIPNIDFFWSMGKMKMFIVGVFIVCSIFSYAEGQKELKITENESKKEYKINVDTKLVFGTYEFQMNRTDDKKAVQFVIIKQDGNWRDNQGNLVELTDLVNQLTMMTGEKPSKISVDGGNIITVTTDAGITTGNVSLTESQKALMKQIEVKDSVPYWKINADGKQHNFGIYFIYKDNSFLLVNFKATTEFFTNENNVLNTVCPTYLGDSNYSLRALAFLSTFFNDDTKYRAMVSKYFGISLPAKEQIETTGEIYKNGKQNFIKSFGEHFSNIEYANATIINTNGQKTTIQNGLPHLVFDDKLFNAIYSSNTNVASVMKPNIYVAAYLLYCAEDGVAKPILSYFFKESLPAGIPYEFNKLQAISDDEGKKIAEAALRYLTWGVEYTPYPATGILTGISNNPVYSLNKEMISSWVFDNNGQREPALNYLPENTKLNGISIGAQTKNSTVKQIQVLDAERYGKQFTLIGNMLKGHILSASRIDFWTSANIAWDGDRIQNVFINDQPFEKSQGQKLFDKRVFVDSDVLKNNFEIFRTTTTPSVLSLGYKFTGLEQVGALLLIRGRSEEKLPGKIPPEMKIKYKDYADNEHILEFRKKVSVVANQPAESKVDNGEVIVVQKMERGPLFAFDNNLSSYWNSNPIQNPAFQVTFDQSKKVSAIRITWGSSVNTYKDVTKYFNRENIYKVKIELTNDSGKIVLDKEYPIGNSGELTDIALGNEYPAVKKLKLRIFNLVNVGSVIIREIDMISGNFYEIANTNGAFSYNDLGVTENNNLDFILSKADNKLEPNNIIYNYIIFDLPVNCKEIKITDSEHDFLNIAEFAVFSKNPINYITESRNTFSKSIKQSDFIDYTKQYSAIPGKIESYDFNTYNNLLDCLFNTKPDTAIIEINPVQKKDISLSVAQIGFKKASDIQQIIFWEKSGSGDLSSPIKDSNDFKRELIVLCDLPFGDMYFSDQDEYLANIKKLSDSGKLKSPFKREGTVINPDGSEITGLVVPMAGNPLPYAPMGIDTPRSFNYKMSEQLQTAKLILQGPCKDSTSALLNMPNEKYQNYVNEIDLFRKKNKIIETMSENGFLYNKNEANYLGDLSIGDSPNKYQIRNDQGVITSTYILKPFLPGLLLNNTKGFVAAKNSLYSPDKIAGVDSIGILSGVISMSGISDKFVNAYNLDVNKLCNDYYKMSTSDSQQKLAGGSANITIPLDGLSKVEGAEDNYKPSFYINGQNEKSFLTAPYRFTAADLERSTIVIPRLTMVREGDLVVKLFDENEIIVGIVVATPSSYNIDPNSLDEDHIMNSILVLSIRRGMQMATIGTWGNPDGVFGGFAENPKEYHVRRLLKITNDNYNIMVKKYDDIEWELVKYQIKCLNVKIDLPLDRYFTNPAQVNHYIPNTGEYLGDIQIHITGAIEIKNPNKNISDSYETVLPTNIRDIQFAPTRDINFNNNELSGDNNINTNKGDGIIVYFRDEDIATNVELDNKALTSNYQWLVKFHRKKSNSSDLMKDNYYSMEFNPEYYSDTVNGILKSNSSIKYRLFVNDDNLLVFSKQTGNNDPIIRQRFAIRPNYSNIRPGDDFILRFALQNNASAAGPSDEQVDSIYPYYFQVYDKKLLWRANLYIDEGANDWNNKNTWNAPPDLSAENTMRQNNLLPYWWSKEYGYNEWNRAMNSNNLDTTWTSTGNNPWLSEDVFSLENQYLSKYPAAIDSNLGIVPGGQVVSFHLWTGFLNTDSDIRSVAYGWGTQDSPFEFEHELLEQKKYIKDRRNKDATDNDGTTDYDALSWTDAEVLAPNSNWDNYIFPKRHRLYSDTTHTHSFYSYDGDNPDIDDTAFGGGNLSETQHKYTLVIGKTCSIPGLGTCLTFLGNPDFPYTNRNPGNALTDPTGPFYDPAKMWNFGPEQAEYTSGLDCSGFIWRSMAYRRADNYFAYKAINRDATKDYNLWQIADRTATGSASDQPGNLNKVIPGDVMQWPGSHIVIVLNVTRNTDGSVKRENIRFIHSGSGQYNEWQVLTNKIWKISEGLGDSSYFKYRVLRLIPIP